MPETKYSTDRKEVLFFAFVAVREVDARWRAANALLLAIVGLACVTVTDWVGRKAVWGAYIITS